MTKRIYTEQAYLLWATSQDDSFIKKEEKPGKARTRKFVKEINGAYEPQNVVSEIMSPKNRSNPKEKKANVLFFNLENYKLSSLVPELRLFKEERGEYVPFYFPINTEFESVTGGGALTSRGTSIDSFTVKYQGTDLYTNDKFLECDLSIKVESLANIFAKPPEGFARLADLFTIRTPRSMAPQGSITPGQQNRSIEILATLGYSVMDQALFTNEEIDAIRKVSQVIRMNVFDHTIQLDQNGTATISISYTARFEKLGGKKNISALFSATATAEDVLEAAKLAIFQVDEKKVASAATAKKTQKTKKGNRIKNTKIAKQLQQVSFMIEQLDGFSEAVQTRVLRSQFIAGGNPPAQQSFSVTPPPLETANEGKNTLLVGTLEKIRKTFEDISEPPPVPFVFFGDIIEAYFQKVKGNLQSAATKAKKETNKDKKKNLLLKIRKDIETLDSFKVLLPNVVLEFTQPGNNAITQKKTLNLASLPVSLRSYHSFVYGEILNNHNVKNFTLSIFLNKVTVLLDKIFSQESVKLVLDKEIKFKSLIYSGPKMRAFTKSNDVSIESLSGPNVFKNLRELKDNMDYFLIYQENEQSTSNPSSFSGISAEDAKRGIYHFHLGADRGLIKSINFSKFEVPYKAESLMVEQVNLYDELKMPYSANVTMFGNNLFLPGSQIYIDPYTIGFGDPQDKNSAAVDLGLGGYYEVLKVSTTVTGGSMETQLECSFGSPSNAITGRTP